MAGKDYPPDTKDVTRNSSGEDGGSVPAYEGVVEGEQVYHYEDSRKLGVTSAVFLILNKMIGTGSACAYCPQRDWLGGR